MVADEASCPIFFLCGLRLDLQGVMIATPYVPLIEIDAFVETGIARC